MPIMLIALAGTAFLNICYFLSFFRFAFYKKRANSNTSLPAVSVIICAKNEAENLKEYLPKFLDQDHQDYEIILINDASNDETLEVMEEFQKRDGRIKIVNVENNEAFWANKKYALTLGIKKAKNPYLLFTDADCVPVSSTWITEMSSQFTSKKSFVLGYGGYFINKSSFLNKLIRFETLLTAIQYFSYSLWGNPYMGVGRNLAYTSSQFYSQSGFASHLHLRSGDDDLFVNEGATGENTAICANEGAITRSTPKKTWKQWFIQKRRHVSVASKYKWSDKLLLGLFYATQLLFWILLIYSLTGTNWRIAAGILAARIIIQGIVFYKTSRKLGEKDLIWIFPVLELFLISAQLGIFISNLISKPTHWK